MFRLLKLQRHSVEAFSEVLQSLPKKAENLALTRRALVISEILRSFGIMTTNFTINGKVPGMDVLQKILLCLKYIKTDLLGLRLENKKIAFFSKVQMDFNKQRYTVAK